ncbi:MAG TPA: SBBP repeat-containing protein [Gemmataceae bacterium]|nr:SBBP repeat-containing protein [Gemmataceae bacterium]
MWFFSRRPTNAAKQSSTRRVRVARRPGSARLSLEQLEERSLLSSQSALAAAYGQLPLAFEANQGQAAPQIDFLSRGNGYTLALAPDSAQLSLQQGATNNLLQMQLLGANPAAPVAGLNELITKTNYLIGNDPSQWHTNIANYGQVEYQNVYPGINVIYYGNQQQLEYDFQVAPGANPGVIQLAFTGVQAMSLDAQGNLVLQTSGGDVVEKAPVVYQQDGNIRQQVAGKYVLEAGDRAGFAVGAYDASRPLIVDPILSYSTYVGGSGTDSASAIAVDSAGNAYITGQTYSSNFPTTAGAFQTTLAGSANAFVAKLNASGTSLVYSTYLGGNSTDGGNAIAVDAYGDAYVTGGTSSTNFPTTAGAFQTTPGSGFVTELNPNGTALAYSTYFASGCSGIAVDGRGNAYLTGSAGANFPTTAGAFQVTLAGSADAFVTKLTTSGTGLVYSTRLGGSGGGAGASIAVDSAGNAYVTGSAGANFPTTAGAFQITLAGSAGAFVTKLNAWGTALVYSTYLGGTTSTGTLAQYGTGIAVDSAGNAYITGATSASNFPTTPGAFQTTPGSGFVTKLNSAGSALVYSSYFVSGGLGIALDTYGNAYVTGYTGSSNFPTTANAFQTTLGGSNGNAFVTEMNDSGSALVYSTYLGGSGGDQGNGIALDSAGNFYVAGEATPTFPTTAGAYQTTYSGGAGDAFVAKFAAGVAINSTGLPAATVGASYSQTLTASGGTAPYTFAVTGGSLPAGLTLSAGGVLSGIPTAAGASTFTVTATDANSTTGSLSYTLAANLATQLATGWIATASGPTQGGGGGGMVATDSAGDTYFAVNATGTATFGSNISMTGTNYSCVGELNSSGNWLWVTQLPNNARFYGGALGGGLAVDSSGDPYNGDVYVAGFFAGTATFGSTILTSAGASNIFVSQLNSSGGFNWTIQIGGTGYDLSHGLALDGSGNLYVTGGFQNTVSFGGTRLTSAGGYDAFLTKITPNATGGTFDWAVRLGGANDDVGNALAVDSAGNAFMSCVLNSTTIASTATEFVDRFDTNGNLIWSYNGGNGGDLGYADSLALYTDGSGNDFLYQAGPYGTAVLKLDGTSGNSLWVKNFNLNGDQDFASGNDSFYGVATDSTGNVYVTGKDFYEGDLPIGFDPASGTGYLDTPHFVAKLDPNGNFLAALSTGGYAVAVDANGNIHSVGSPDLGFGSVAAYDTGSQNVLAPSSSSLVVALTTQNEGGILGRVFDDVNDNGTLDPNENGVFPVTVLAYDTNNNLVASTMAITNAVVNKANPAIFGEYDLTHLAPGTYTIRVILPPGWIQTSPAGGALTVTVTAGQDVDTQNFGAYFPSQTTTYKSPNVPVSIPAGGKKGGTTVTSTLTVPNNARLFSLQVTTNVTGAAGDSFSLTTPSGASLPVTVNGTLSEYIVPLFEQNVSGTWKLSIVTAAGAPKGTLNSWSITVIGGAVPQIGAFTASSTSVKPGGSLTLTASNITDGNANTSITQLTFYYLNSSGNEVILGYGTQTSPGVWTVTFTVNLAAGSYTLFAQAEDSDDIFSEPFALTLTVT